jgi:hypothetical protein
LVFPANTPDPPQPVATAASMAQLAPTSALIDGSVTRGGIA